jgi:hypothetical protein
MRRNVFIKKYYQRFYYYQNFQNSFNKRLTTEPKTQSNTQPSTQESKSKIISEISRPSIRCPKTLVTGVMTTLLACSEALPFISEIESNGILEFFSKLFKSLR